IIGLAMRRQLKRQRHSARNKFLYFSFFNSPGSVIFKLRAPVFNHSGTYCLTMLPRLATIAAVESMSNDRIPAHIRALQIAAQAVGALAVGALAIGALAIGALAIGRLVIGRSRIRRLQIDELVVARLQVT